MGQTDHRLIPISMTLVRRDRCLDTSLKEDLQADTREKESRQQKLKDRDKERRQEKAEETAALDDRPRVITKADVQWLGSFSLSSCFGII